MILIFIVGFGLVLLAGTLHATLYGPRAKARKRLREASRNLEDGAVVTLTGKVIAKAKRVEAPLSGREGVAYAASARIYTKQRGYNKRVVDEVVETLMVELELETKDHVVLVVGEEPHIEFPGNPVIPRKLDREQRFLAVHGHADISAATEGFDEVVIVPGMKVSVHGVVHIEVAGAESYRETGKRSVLAGHPAHPLTIGRPI